ncbi:hypothetical protein [Streptomyces sp. NPDC049915]|uniref:hypothetical protein n=1 Tax=Streptomyces sp. NPDC049915 TaxID=3155510 RepID=UPI00343A28DB
MGIFLKNARAAARKAQEIEQRRAEGLPVSSSAGALSQERREQLEDIDPAWCPTWPVEWQRCFHLTRHHLEQGGELPTKPGNIVHQGEDLGRWVRSVRLGWDNLTTVQQWMCEHILGIQPATDDEKPKPRTSQAEKWALHLAAARQFYEPHPRRGSVALGRSLRFFAGAGPFRLFLFVGLVGLVRSATAPRDGRCRRRDRLRFVRAQVDARLGSRCVGRLHFVIGVRHGVCVPVVLIRML